MGAPTPGGRQHTILPKFPKNCMKLKEFGPGGRPKFYYVDPPLRGDFWLLENCCSHSEETVMPMLQTSRKTRMDYCHAAFT